MPNWCSTNYVIRGSKEDLSAFVKTLNTMENNPNGFGRYWMGNLLVALGLKYEDLDRFEISHRGTFSPNPNECACFFGPDVDETQMFSVDDDGLLRLSTISAWGKCDSLEEFLICHFPSLQFYWYTTDEFGNFHYVHDPEDLGNFDYYYLSSDYESSYYTKDDFENFLNDFRELCPDLNIPRDREYLASDKFIDEFIRWKEADEARWEIYFYVAEEV